jgi:hypothetical protein
VRYVSNVGLSFPGGGARRRRGGWLGSVRGKRSAVMEMENGKAAPALGKNMPKKCPVRKLTNFQPPPPHDTLLYIEGGLHPRANTTHAARISIGGEKRGDVT